MEPNIIKPPLAVQKTSITDVPYTLLKNEVYKYGNVVTVNIVVSQQITPASNAWIVLGYLPEGYRPPSEMDFAATNNVNDTYIHVRVSTNGVIRYYGFNGVNALPYFSISFIVE